MTEGDLSKWKHRISHIDPILKQADCAECGRTRIKIKSGGWRCARGTNRWSGRAPVDMGQREIGTFAKRVVERLPGESLEGRVPRNLRAELRTLHELDGPTFRAALAVAEASLALRSLALRNEYLELRTSGSVLLRNGKTMREVPPDYFAARVAQYVDVLPSTAQALWSAIVGLAVEGGVGLPELYCVDRTSMSATLRATAPNDRPSSGRTRVGQ